MVRVGDTYVRSGASGDVGDYIVVDFAVVRVKPKIYGDIGVQGFKIGYCLFIDFGLKAGKTFILSRLLTKL